MLQGDLVNVTADAIVHPTNSTFYMGGEVGKFRLSLFNISKTYHKTTIMVRSQFTLIKAERKNYISGRLQWISAVNVLKTIPF